MTQTWFIENRLIGAAYLIILASYVSLATRHYETDPQLFRGYLLYSFAYIFFAIPYFLGTSFTGLSTANTEKLR